MYIFLSITVLVFLFLWGVLRHYTRTWVQRQMTAPESIVAGIAAWLFVFVLIGWGVELVYVAIKLFTLFDMADLWALILGIAFTGYCLEFVFSTRSELVLDETIDFIKEALQFRRSAQQRITVLELLKQRRQERKQRKKTTRQDIERDEVKARLNQERAALSIAEDLKAGKTVSLTSLWKALPAKYVNHQFYDAITEIKIDPHRKQLMIMLDLPAYNEVSFEKDEVAEVKLYREIYDFLVLIQDDPRLRTYTQFFESVYLLGRRISRGIGGEEFFTPFIKVGARLDEIRETLGTYFNPRKLPTIAAVAFKKGLPV